MAQDSRTSRNPFLIVGAVAVVVAAVAVVFMMFFVVGPKRMAAPPAAAPISVSAAAALAPAARSTGRVQGPDGVSVLSWAIKAHGKGGRFSKVYLLSVRNHSAVEKNVRMVFSLYDARGTQTTAESRADVVHIKPGATKTTRYLIFDNAAASARLERIEVKSINSSTWVTE